MTLTETLLVISIIGLLLAMTFPAIQAARHAGWRTACASNLRQMGQAIEGYVGIHGTYPPGAERGYSLHVKLLPHLEQDALYRRIDFTLDAESGNLQVVATHLPVYVCPVESPLAKWVTPFGREIAGSNYAGNFGSGVPAYGYNGVFRHVYAPGESTDYPEGPVSPANVTDGLARTAAMSEIVMSDGTRSRLRVNWNTARSLTAPSEFDAFCSYCRTEQHAKGNAWARGRPWTYGEVGYTMYNHAITPNQQSCINGSFVQEGAYTAASLHLGGVNVLFADGHTEFISDHVSTQIWRALGSRNGKDRSEP
ncbi:MAG: DUF1559 domain-containing protein [Planctomycetia bacterium]|nr:DUF1559 domain-containing protein [Planctomycetia bacterium]